MQHITHLVSLDLRQNCGIDVDLEEAVQALDRRNEMLYQNETNAWLVQVSISFKSKFELCNF